MNSSRPVPINPESTFKPVAEAVMRTLAEEAVILHLGTGNYFGLDAMGTRVWQLLESGRNRSELLAELLDEYEVSPEVLAQDVDAFLQSLKDNGLIEPA